MLDVYVVNESTVVSDADAFKIAWSLNYQAKYHMGRSGWRSDVGVYYVQRGVQPIILAGQAILHLLDTSDVQGALGYHDEDGNEVAYIRVFAKTCQQYGESVSACCSHELGELVADQHVNLSSMTADGSRLYAVEVGDPVQGTNYDVGAPEGKTLGVEVANFALPAYFDPNSRPGRKVDFRGVLNGPFTIAPQGYMSYIDTANFQAGWQDEFGAERTTPPPPDLDERRERRVSSRRPESDRNSESAPAQGGSGGPVSSSAAAQKPASTQTPPPAPENPSGPGLTQP